MAARILISQSAKKFFSICVIEADLEDDLATIGVLVDNRSKAFKETDYTFFIFIDSSRKYEGKTDDFKTMFKKKGFVPRNLSFCVLLRVVFSIGEQFD